MMSVDRSVLRSVWEGRLPVCFELAASESSTSPDNFYLMLPRQAYLPMVMEKVRRHFLDYVVEPGAMWVEHNDKPLQWHLPLGLLYDLCVNNEKQEPKSSQRDEFNEDYVEEDRNKRGSKLPWVLTVRFHDFPSKELIAFDNRESVESLFMSSVKEADQLKHGGKVVSSMQKRDHHQLWQGIINDKFDQFWSVNRRLMDPLSDEAGFRHVPLKIFLNGEQIVQRLYRAKNEERRDVTLKDVLAMTLPEMKNFEKVRVVSQGIEVPHETPLQWLSEHLSYPDNFLYLCINSREAEEKSENTEAQREQVEEEKGKEDETSSKEEDTFKEMSEA